MSSCASDAAAANPTESSRIGKPQDEVRVAVAEVPAAITKHLELADPTIGRGIMELWKAVLDSTRGMSTFVMKVGERPFGRPLHDQVDGYLVGQLWIEGTDFTTLSATLAGERGQILVTGFVHGPVQDPGIIRSKFVPELLGAKTSRQLLLQLRREQSPDRFAPWRYRDGSVGQYIPTTAGSPGSTLSTSDQWCPTRPFVQRLEGHGTRVTRVDTRSLPQYKLAAAADQRRVERQEVSGLKRNSEAGTRSGAPPDTNEASLTNALAILPFGGDDDSELGMGFSRGLAYLIAADLSRIRDLTVLSPTVVSALLEPDTRPGDSDATHDIARPPVLKHLAVQIDSWGRFGIEKYIKGTFTLSEDSLALEADLISRGARPTHVGPVMASAEAPLKAEKLLLEKLLKAMNLNLGQDEILLLAPPKEDFKGFMSFSKGVVEEEQGNVTAAREAYSAARKSPAVGKLAERRQTMLRLDSPGELSAIAMGYRWASLSPAFDLRASLGAYALGLRQLPADISIDLPLPYTLGARTVSVGGAIP
jgi:hypothetical protein